MAIFDEKIEIRERYISSPRRIPRERCKGVHCVDLCESFPTRIYLQKSASIQPRTSPSKYWGKFNSLFTSLLTQDHPLQERLWTLQVRLDRRARGGGRRARGEGLLRTRMNDIE